MDNVVIDLYVDNSEKSKKIERFLIECSVPYARHEEPMPEYDQRLSRPYLTIGDRNGTPLGPTANLQGIESTVKRLCASNR